MRPSFNVLDAPWIPVVTLDGTKELLGIRDTLRRTPELKEISVVSPLEEFSVYRFLMRCARNELLQSKSC